MGKRTDWEREKQVSKKNGVDDSSLRGKSALSRRIDGTNGKPELISPSILDSIATIAEDKNELQKKMEDDRNDHVRKKASIAAATAAASRVSDIIAKAGSGVAFDGQTLGVGGLDDVLVQIKRRIWTPLAAPPQLLKGKF